MSQIVRIFKTALQYMMRNFGLSFASIIVMTLSFFIVSFVGLAFFGSLKLVEYFDSKPALVIFLRGDISEEEVDEFRNVVEGTGYVRDMNINDLDFSQENFESQYPDMEGTINEENINSLSRVTFIYSDSQEHLQSIITELEKNENFITNIADQRNPELGWYSFNLQQAEVTREAFELIRTAGVAITIFLFFISSILIFITVKLTITYHRRELEIMELVGADGWFIKMPFIIDGMIYGILGGLLSTSIIVVFKNIFVAQSQSFVPRIQAYFSEVPWPTIDNQLILEATLVTCGIGALIGIMSSFFAIMRHVKK
ncbi:MAG: cell division protein FtsX [Candidatus Dojkabacteria bacterium]